MMRNYDDEETMMMNNDDDGTQNDDDNNDDGDARNDDLLVYNLNLAHTNQTPKPRFFIFIALMIGGIVGLFHQDVIFSAIKPHLPHFCVSTSPLPQQALVSPSLTTNAKAPDVAVRVQQAETFAPGKTEYFPSTPRYIPPPVYHTPPEEFHAQKSESAGTNIPLTEGIEPESHYTTDRGKSTTSSKTPITTPQPPLNPQTPLKSHSEEYSVSQKPSLKSKGLPPVSAPLNSPPQQSPHSKTLSSSTDGFHSAIVPTIKKHENNTSLSPDHSTIVPTIKKYYSRASLSPDNLAKVRETRKFYLAASRIDGKIVLRTGGNVSWRFNNPGRIKDSEFARQMGAIGSDGTTAIFPSYDLGRKAMETYLFTDVAGYHKRALGKIFPRDSRQFVLHDSGLPSNLILDKMTPDQRSKLLDTIQKMEGYIAGKVVVFDDEKQFSAQGW